MRRTAYRKNMGGMWAMGFGLLSLLVAVAIIVWLVSIQTDHMVSSTGGKGPVEMIKDVRVQVHGLEREHNDSVNNAIKDATGTAKPAGSSTTQPAASPPASPAPAPVAEAPVPAAPAPARAPSGVPEAGSPIGPISPVTPVAPMHAGPGPNLRPATRPIEGINKTMDERNKELEKALNGG